MRLSDVFGWMVAGVAALVLLTGAEAEQAGSFDTAFRPPVTTPDVVSLLVTDDGSVYAGGVTGIGLEGRNRSLVKFKADGTLDTSFVAGGEVSIGEPLSLAVDSQGRILAVSRTYRSDLGTSEYLISRLLPSGAIDPSFGRRSISTGTSNSASVVRVDTNDRIYVGGEFYGFEGHPGYLVRLDANGQVDRTFTYRGSTSVTAIDFDSKGRIVVGGNRYRVERLYHDGTKDPTFDAPVYSENYFAPIRSIFVDQYDRVILAGPSIRRLRTDGTEDSFFSIPALQTSVDSAARGPNGTIIYTTGTGVYRLLESGVPDESFQATGVGGGLQEVATTLTGDVILGGYFQSIDGNEQKGVARLHGGFGSIFTFSQPRTEAQEDADTAHFVTIRRIGKTDTAESIIIRTGDGSAKFGEDYVKFSTLVAFAAGEVEKSLPVYLVDDQIPEADESFPLTMYGSQTAAIGRIAVIHIDIPRQEMGTAVFADSTFVTNESSERAILTLRRIGGREGALTITLSPSWGTAIVGMDIVPTLDPIVFAHGEYLKFVEIPLRNNTLAEPAKEFTLTVIQDPAPAEPSSCTVRILDGDTGTIDRFAGSYQTFLPIEGSASLARLSATLTKSGQLTGKLLFGTRALKLQGSIGAGYIDLAWPAKGDLPAISLRLWVDDSEGVAVLAGELTGTSESSLPLVVYRKSIFKKATTSEAGQYTAALPARSDTVLPQGWSWLLVRVTGKGNVRWVGRLSDSTPISASGWLTENGSASLAAQPYKSKGFFTTALSFSQELRKTLNGIATWFKPVTNSADYPQSFQHSAELVGSIWEPRVSFPRAGAPGLVIAIPESEPASLTVSAANNSKITYGQKDLTVNLSTGLLQGKIFGNSFGGVWLTDEATGVGSTIRGISNPVEVTTAEN